MDNINLTNERKTSSNVNGSVRRSSASPSSPTCVGMGASSRPITLTDNQNYLGAGQYQIIRVVVIKDENGYGMKVSGDNPVFVQSVKQGGAAEKAGLHAGDRIMEVNGENVISSTHTEVVALIRSSTQAILKVHHKTGGPKVMGSPSIHTRPMTTHSPSRITGPQPVDNETQVQLQLEREQHYRLMIEKERRYLDVLRSEIINSPDDKKLTELEKTERNLQKLLGMLQGLVKSNQSEQPSHTHQRTKSSPESLISLNPTEASKRMISSESMIDFVHNERYDATGTPPGTPPPPYPSPLADRRSFSNRNSGNTDDGNGSFEEITMDVLSSPDLSPLAGNTPSQTMGILAKSTPIHAATPQTTQQSIISMEDDEISEQDVSQLEDHGPFKSLSQLWHKNHLPYLAVFTNYVLSNSDPNSLLFYLITDLYKEGNAKEMRKWAYEIHSCFLVPGAPLRISNVDEAVAHEIDEVLQNEYEREEILRKIFWKARNKSKEELTKQLVDFQQKRVAGLGTIFGPPDSVLVEICHDKTSGKDIKHYESLLDRLDPYLEELDKTNYDPKKYYTAAALATVITRIFSVRPSGTVMDKCPTFVNKEKSLRSKLIARNRKMCVQGHQYSAQQYYTVIRCNNCHQIIYGISPQGYECLICHINLHRPCIHQYDDVCPGPIKQKGMLKLMDRIRPEHKEQRKKQSAAHFLQSERERRVAEDRDNGLDLNESGETKPGNPVTRTPSDRRPDAVREESSRTQDPNQSQDHENDPSNVESSTSLPASTGNKRRQQSNVHRSESVKEHTEKNRKQRRNISDPLHNTGERLDFDNGISYNQHSGSSSNSSLCSSRSLESPSGSLDIVGGLSDGQTERDSDMEVEADPPDWKSALTEEQLSQLPTHEKKRQDVINELFHTERSHVRNLKVLDQIFRKEIVRSKILTEAELKLVFPNLPDLLGIHNQFNTVMKNKRKESQIVTEVGDILLNMFDGDKGIVFRNAAAKFCAKQQLALAFIKEKRKKDTKFENVLINCEKNNHCRRLPLQGFLPQEMQRLSKYPLLLERLIDNEEKTLSRCPDRSPSELEKLEKALIKSREILNEVNDAAKRACNRARLEHINAHLDTDMFHRSDNAIVTEYKYFDLMKYTLIYEGTVTLRRQNKTPIPVHMLLTEEAVILLVKEGERYLLKFFHSSTGQQSLAPIIKMQNVICRKNAADNVTLYLVSNTQNSQMYEIQCRDSTERKMWFKYFTDASEPYKLRDGKGKRSERTQDPEEETVQDLPASRSEPGERAEAVSDDAECAGSSSSSSDPNQRNSDVLEEGGRDDKSITQVDDGAIPPVHAAGGEGVSVKLIPNDWPLIQPSEVQVAIPPVHTAEPVLTALEQIKRKDEEVKQALAAKEVLVADLLSIPREDFHLIADIASDEATNKESSQWELSELVLAAAYQVDQLIEAVNESLNITETDAVLAMGGKHPSCASNESVTKVNNFVPSVPASKLQLIATTLNSQLTILMSAVKGVEEDRDRLRKELHRNREQLHEKSNLHGPLSIEDECTQIDSTQSGDLESIEESPTETETT